MFNLVDAAVALSWRDEDLRHRALENRRREIDDTRRAVDEKAEQLKAISNLSALIAGFAMVAQTNLGIPSDIEFGVLCLFGFSVASVVCLMMIAMLNSTFLLIAVYRYNVSENEDMQAHFETFWDTWCKKDWRIAVNAFSLGVPMFLVMLAFTSYIDFSSHPDGNSGTYIVCGICLVALVYWYLVIWRKWGRYIIEKDEAASGRALSVGGVIASLRGALLPPG